MKSLRNIKLRTLSRGPVELILANVNNPLKKSVPVNPSHRFSLDFLEGYKHPVDINQMGDTP